MTWLELPRPPPPFPSYRFRLVPTAAVVVAGGFRRARGASCSLVVCPFCVGPRMGPAPLCGSAVEGWMVTAQRLYCPVVHGIYQHSGRSPPIWSIQRRSAVNDSAVEWSGALAAVASAAGWCPAGRLRGDAGMERGESSAGVEAAASAAPKTRETSGGPATICPARPPKIGREPMCRVIDTRLAASFPSASSVFSPRIIAVASASCSNEHCTATWR